MFLFSFLGLFHGVGFYSVCLLDAVSLIKYMYVSMCICIVHIYA